jgi:recombination protein RecA
VGYKRGLKPAEPKKPKGPKSNPTVDLISSGSDLLDLALGGGFPLGKVINVIGDKSSGKTLLICEAIARAYAKYNDVRSSPIYNDKIHIDYDDTEAGMSFDTEEIWGFKMPILVDKEGEDDCSETVEDLISSVKKRLKPYLKSKTPCIYIVDSLDGLTSESEIEHADNREKARENGTKQTGTYGTQKAKLLSEFFRLVKNDLKDSNCLLIVISQIRDKIGVTFGKRTTRSGGRALDFYCSQIIELAEVEKLENTVQNIKRKVGVRIRANVAKNKIAKPFRQAEFQILFDYGVDNIDSNLCFLFDLLTDTGKTKKRVDIEWDNEKFTDRAKLISYIEENNQEEVLLKAVKEKWYSIEDSFKPQRKRK